MHGGLLILALPEMEQSTEHIEDYLRENCTSIFSHPVFLQKMHPENYGYASSTDAGSNIQAVLPFAKYTNTGFKRVSMPLFAQYTPLTISYPEGLLKGRKFSFELQVMEQLIDRLPKADHYLFQLPFHHQNIMPFLLAGFESSVRYSFTFDRGFSLHSIHENMRSSHRRKLRKLNKLYQMENSEHLDLIIEFTDTNYTFKQEENPFSHRDYKALFEVGKQLNCCQLVIARDEQHKVVGTHFYLWDKEYVHYLIGATDPEYRNTGVSTALIWKGLELANELGLGFNFEGSMTPSIAHYFSSFGARLTPYYRVEKYRNKIAKVLRENLGKKKELTKTPAPSKYKDK